jgi:predicted phage baseplate assembly protein
VFTTSIAEDGKTVVQFGDGQSGARPPTGRDDVRASYRVGTGKGGLAAAEQLSLLMTRPLGVKDVRNPLPARGAQDPQVAADAASNAPRSVLTLNRIVSLRDYEDFAINVAGVGKATATWTWDGIERGVVVTIAGLDGAMIEAGSPLLATLTSALRAAGNPRIPLFVRPAHIGRFVLQAELVILANRVAESVVAAAETQLQARYSFEQRTFGQIISLGEVVEALHAVEGIVGVQVGRLHRAEEAAVRRPFILAGAVVPGRPPPSEGAELLLIDPDGVELEVAR